MNCLDGSLGRCIGGSWLQNYSYVVLEHGIMDKKCGVCPHHNYRDLERVLNGKRKCRSSKSPSQISYQGGKVFFIKDYPVPLFILFYFST